MALDPAALALDAGHPLRRARPVALGAGLGALALCGLGAIFDPQQFLRSYLVGYLFVFGIALGCLAVLMIHHIAGGAWGAVVRRVLESAAGTVPLLALLFLPIALGVHQLYEWAHPGALEHDPLLRAKSAYLNVPFFLSRAVVYFVAWSLIALYLNRWSSEQDRAPDPALTRRLELLSRGGLVLYGLTVTFAAIDWAMSLEPHWFSTIYGLLLMGGQGVAAFAFVIPIAALLRHEEVVARLIGRDQFRDLGSLLLAFVMIWAYLSISQLLIIWSGNLPEEIPWYLKRTGPAWQGLALVLVVFHFAAPFVVLLVRRSKQNARVLAHLAGALLVMRFLDVYWQIAPAFHEGAFAPHWLDLAVPVTLAALWVGLFLRNLHGRPLVSLQDAKLLGSLEAPALDPPGMPS